MAEVTLETLARNDTKGAMDLARRARENPDVNGKRFGELKHQLLLLQDNPIPLFQALKTLD